MIWKSKDVLAEAYLGELFIKKKLRDKENIVSHKNSVFKIGIVGGGPKGLYALEELFSRIKNENIVGRLEVTWWNKTEDFGCGPNYQVDQPDYLLINYCIGHIDAWDRTRNAKIDSVNFIDWINKFKAKDQDAKPTDYASRSLVGKYLQYVTMQVIDSKPENIHLRLFAEEVINIEANSKNKLIIKSDSNELGLDNLLLCTGHCYQNISLADFPNNIIPENYFKNAYPIQSLSKIGKRKKVGVIGWGLTFIDVALHMSEGRGGFFDNFGNYNPSGKEPILIPFSRNQLPIMPRGPIFGENTYKLYYLNKKWYSQFQKMLLTGKIDFKNEIFPWLEKEIQFAYYSTLLQSRDPNQIEAYILRQPEIERFKTNDLLFPKVSNCGTLKESFISYLNFLINEAEKGELISPLMAAAAVWREASPMITELYRGGGFTGESQQYLDKELFGAFCRTSYGPPIENIKKIKALLKADVVQVHFDKDVNVVYNINQFMLKSKNIRINVDFIVDARIARPNLHKNNSNFYKSLSKNNLVIPFINEGYHPGCISMNTNGKILQKKHEVPLYAYGSNSEGFLLDNDSLSRKKNSVISCWSAEIINQIQNID